ncbi:type I-E CRISPR-associated protein Cse1/CasA [Collinsella tanakaei]|nr:type I-E CRISPR-associated protein Cse1/CasA [Collinsella tanakaei]
MAETSSQSIHFNLLDEPWVPVLLLDGTTDEVSLRDLFARAHLIRSVSGDIVLERITIQRLALAVLYCAYWQAGDSELATEGSLTDLWNQLFSCGRFEMGDIDPYLSDVHDRFDLFGPEPFYQVEDLAYAAKGLDPISELIIDMPKPKKFLFSMRSNHGPVGLTCAEAARYLLLAQAYNPAGVKSPVVGFRGVKNGKAYAPNGMLGTGWCGSIGGLFIEGENLFETIMRNWVLFLNGKKLLGIEGDLPPWERPASNAEMVVREPVGPIDLLTWQGRRIRLVLDEKTLTVYGVVICYGDATRAADKYDFELMTSWRESKEQQKKLQTAHVPLMPIAPDSSKVLWRGLSSLLGVSRDGVTSGGDLRSGVVRWADHLERVAADGTVRHRPVRVRAQGVVYKESSVIIDMVDDYIDLDATLLHRDAEVVSAAIEMVAQAEGSVHALVRFVQNVQIANGADQPVADEGVRERAYDELDGIFRRRLAHCAPENELDVFCNAWRDEIRVALDRIAVSYLASSGFSAFRESKRMTSGRAIAMFRASLAKYLAHTGEADGAASVTDEQVEEVG